MKKFLKSADLDLINGGYLTIKGEGTPVSNESFVKAQKHAEYIITFAKMAKGKDFVGKPVDSLADLEKAVKAELAKKAKTYVPKPEKVVKKLTEELASEAMAFMSFKKETSKVEKINAFLQQFNVLSEFEEFGLFFEEDIVKLTEIYTMEEIITAVKETIDLLK